MIEVKVDNEYSALKSVILGLAEDMGDPPKVFDVYDPRSLYHIRITLIQVRLMSKKM